MNIHTFRAKLAHDKGASRITVTVFTFTGNHEEAKTKALEQIQIVERCPMSAIKTIEETNFKTV